MTTMGRLEKFDYEKVMELSLKKPVMTDYRLMRRPSGGGSVGTDVIRFLLCGLTEQFLRRGRHRILPPERMGSF